MRERARKVSAQVKAISCDFFLKQSLHVLPDTFKVSQVYAIIVLPNGGPDLEAYTFYNASRTGWRQASSVFWQVAKALAHAEQLVCFEVSLFK